MTAEKRLEQPLLLDQPGGRDAFAPGSPEPQEVAGYARCREVIEALKKEPSVFFEESAGVRPSVQERLKRAAIRYALFGPVWTGEEA